MAEIAGKGTTHDQPNEPRNDRGNDRGNDRVDGPGDALRNGRVDQPPDELPDELPDERTGYGAGAGSWGAAAGGADAPAPQTPAQAPEGEPLFAVDPLVVESWGGALVVSSPRLRRRLRVQPWVAQLLLAARTGLLPGEWEGEAGRREAVRTLAEAGFLVREKEPAGEAEPPWDDWGVTAWSLHNRTRDTPFVGARGDDPERLRRTREAITSRPRPSSVRRAATDRILLLPRVRTPLSTPYREVLEARRTHRDFEEREIGLDLFSDMLHYCFAPLRFADAGEMGVLQLRAPASGGARHETEAFVFPLAVRGVRPGLYHYDNIRHGLVPLAAPGPDSPGDAADPETLRARLERLTHGQGFFRHAAFGVLTAAVARRMSWKYRHPRTYKLLLQNVGHVAQVFSMTATALGLGAAITGAIRDSEADALLGLDQPGEFTTFALACGVPRLGADGLPLSIRTPREAPERW
ncbi:SagB/ThcOx family dehydrogenase [Streptomyces hoynatensis]|uniref:SagB/ThcOx family dehydrogenase n=1 Tax=Streptomyces hoynatensis TaxID=1141874 RepID=A0A3A9Z6Q9_9ACTN|nr:SagB/ThcOx family dehydrogenase [Streptomyces hoynatensis]RKN43953.1 SagB/ThcOx family dehydrogenase [Streptomyces hoynatensis]